MPAQTPPAPTSKRRIPGCKTGVALLLLASVAADASHRDEILELRSKDKIERYAKRTIDGFTVHVDERLLAADSELGARALDLMHAQLSQIARVLRAEPLARLRAIPLWLGVEDEVAPCACYHPSPEWLEQHGFAREKAKGVEIAHVQAFLDWTHEQPWMVLHELAHGYRDQFLRGDAELMQQMSALFESAKSSGRFDSVLHWDGSRTRHYALENEDEFFAEMGEAWLGTNDIWPFVHAELVDADPAIAALLRRVWGEPITSRG